VEIHSTYKLKPGECSGTDGAYSVTVLRYSCLPVLICFKMAHLGLRQAIQLVPLDEVVLMEISGERKTYNLDTLIACRDKVCFPGRFGANTSQICCRVENSASFFSLRKELYCSLGSSNYCLSF